MTLVAITDTPSSQISVAQHNRTDFFLMKIPIGCF